MRQLEEESRLLTDGKVVGSEIEHALAELSTMLVRTTGYAVGDGGGRRKERLAAVVVVVGGRALLPVRRTRCDRDDDVTARQPISDLHTEQSGAVIYISSFHLTT